MSSVGTPVAVPPLNRSALWSVIVGVGIWAINAAVGGALAIAFAATPAAGGISGLGPILLLGLSSRILTLVLTLVALAIGFVLARRGLRSTRFGRERGRGLAMIGLGAAWFNVAIIVFGAVELFGTLSVLAGTVR